MKLFFIGNGFDLDHNLKTQYIHFTEYDSINSNRLNEKKGN